MTAISSDKRVPAALGVLGIASAMVLIGTLLPPLPEPQVFQGLADKRTLLGIPNFMNVVSNIPFLLVGIAGIALLRRHPADRKIFADAAEQWPYFVCFAAIALTGLGSCYYHLDIDPYGLFWDRLPMAIGFMSLLSAVIVERIDVRVGLRLLVPLIVLGAASVLYWQWSLRYAEENLLPYAIVQYGSIAAVLVMCAARPSRYTRGADTVIVIGIYALAKLAEMLDARIFALGEVVSGHTLKHLLAAFAAYWLLRMLRLRSIR